MRGFSYKPYSELQDAESKSISLDKDEQGNYTDVPKAEIGFGEKEKQGLFNKANEKLGYQSDDSTLGDKAMGASGEILQTGFQTFANFKNVSESSEERTAQIMQGAAAGAQIGFAAGGPIGGFIGAGVVGGINAIDAASDKRKNIESKSEEAIADFEKKKKERQKRFIEGNSLLGFNQTKVI